jgi:hypothetical protein
MVQPLAQVWTPWSTSTFTTGIFGRLNPRVMSGPSPCFKSRAGDPSPCSLCPTASCCWPRQTLRRSSGRESGPPGRRANIVKTAAYPLRQHSGARAAPGGPAQRPAGAELRGRPQPPGLRKKSRSPRRSITLVALGRARADSARGPTPTAPPPAPRPGGRRPECRPAPSYGVARSRRAFVKRAADTDVLSRAANPPPEDRDRAAARPQRRRQTEPPDQAAGDRAATRCPRPPPAGKLAHSSGLGQP